MRADGGKEQSKSHLEAWEKTSGSDSQTEPMRARTMTEPAKRVLRRPMRSMSATAMKTLTIDSSVRRGAGQVRLESRTHASRYVTSLMPDSRPAFSSE